jgi:hypothetical protein
MFYFTPLPGFFSPFPRGTGSLSVTQEYLALRGGPRGFTRNFSCSRLLGIRLSRFSFQLQDSHLLWCSFPLLRLTATVCCCRPTTPQCMHSGLGCFRFARRYSGNRVCFLFLQLLRCFNSLGWLAPSYGFRRSCLRLPYSDTLGSLLASSSPKHFVGRHVLLRLCVPRYPPSALPSLTTQQYKYCSFNIGICFSFLPDNFTMQFSWFVFAENPSAGSLSFQSSE